ncbi:hypothetical protein LshimejAT787_0410800 [Lyophyllum shimeji]|uniref:Uncharacterized protein n=1 Tax=Lyophyllum shimeji TaxID=47721 RepID=A0A9P3PM73_LYOSH|nr:hypothetical protein LshimejAT787_0410800 [Lyophyllum shimeji]
MGKKKNSKAQPPPPPPLPPPTSQDASPAGKPKKKARAKPLSWADNPSWTQRAIVHLTNDPSFRIKLFSDSTVKAKKEDRNKIQNHDGKSILYQQLGAAIFQDIADEQLREDFAADPARFGRSTQQQFARLKKSYQEYVRMLDGTAGGVRTDEGPAKIRAEWPFWDDLHGFWSELPNYNPVGVTSSIAGQNFSAQAENLFSNQSDVDIELTSGATSEIDDFGDVEEAVSHGAKSGSPLWDLEKDIGEDDQILVQPKTQPTPARSQPSTTPGTPKRSPRLADKAKAKAASSVGRGISPSPITSKPSAVKAKGDLKLKSTYKKRPNPLDSLDDLHAQEIQDAAQRREEKNRIRLKQLELEEKKHEAKLRKLELAARQQDQQLEMMRMLTQALATKGSGSSSMASNSLDLDPAMGLQAASANPTGFPPVQGWGMQPP